MDIRQIKAQDTHPVRHAVLRPNQPISACHYPDDDMPQAGHLGAFVDDALVGIISLYPQTHPQINASDAWRIRGMATLPRVRGLGCGMALLQAAEAYVMQQQGAVMWANARLVAMGFYERAGYQKLGELFEIPNIGPHYVIQKVLSNL